ncbi:MAG: Slp family lipoprotein [Spirochaetes bacterium]|nr:Slp family lipoprotein [Spirochaetota bacterium]
MKNLLKSAYIIISLFLLSGCASVISSDISEKADYSISFKDLLKNPVKFKGRTFILAGEIIETNVKKNRTTMIEIYHRPLGVNDKPDLKSASEGRFLIQSDKYLDPYIFSKGKKITVGGSITGGIFRQIGEMNYFYPVIQSKEIYLWKESRDYDVIIFHDPWPGYYYYPPRRRRIYIHTPPFKKLNRQHNKIINRNKNISQDSTDKI